MDVKITPDGATVITADAYEAATLAGRDQFHDVEVVQLELENKIRDAWYAADCPPVPEFKPRRRSRRARFFAAVGVAALLVFPVAAQASVKNSIQPGKLVFGQVTSGQHPNRLVTLKNGTGVYQQIAGIRVAGSGGYVFTLPANTALIEASGLPTCRVGMGLQPGARCVLDVRVHTSRVGWWRSVLSVVYGSGWFNSGQLEAHVVSAPTVPARATTPGSCTSLATISEACAS